MESTSHESVLDSYGYSRVVDKYDFVAVLQMSAEDYKKQLVRGNFVLCDDFSHTENDVYRQRPSSGPRSAQSMEQRITVIPGGNEVPLRFEGIIHVPLLLKEHFSNDARWEKISLQICRDFEKEVEYSSGCDLSMRYEDNSYIIDLGSFFTIRYGTSLTDNELVMKVYMDAGNLAPKDSYDAYSHYVDVLGCAHKSLANYYPIIAGPDGVYPSYVSVGDSKLMQPCPLQMDIEYFLLQFNYLMPEKPITLDTDPLILDTIRELGKRLQPSITEKMTPIIMELVLRNDPKILTMSILRDAVTILLKE